MNKINKSMKHYLAAIALIIGFGVHAQQKSFEQQVNEISKNITEITEREKSLLKTEVELINKKLEAGEITSEQAQKQKLEASEKRAAIIAESVKVEETKLQELVNARANGDIPAATASQDETFVIGNKTITVSSDDWNWDWDWSDDRDEFKNDNSRPRKTKARRKSGHFVFAFGVNSVLVDHQFNSLSDSDYKTSSFFFELGGAGKFRMSKKQSIFYLKYGGSILWNNLRPTDNRYFVVNGDQTELQTYPVNLKNSARLRNIEFIVPLHLELDFTKPKKYDDGYIRYREGRALRIGMGGYGGFRLQTKQFIKYWQDDIKYKEKSRGSYNASDFIYGLSAYVGYRDTALYMKYDMNPLFKNGDERNISMGLRFDI